jgi:hypothetical protein
LREHPQNSLVATNPTSPEAQKILAGLLSSTEKFGELKAQLVDYGQQEPGIISREGLLVNGNTRLTAIRELGRQGFDVAVLPADATDDDFFQIEMALQLRKYVHQDYTFTNELLLVDDYFTRTRDEQGTINAMQWKKNGLKKLRLAQGHLGLIDEIRSMNRHLRYEFFDKKSEFIRNLYDEFTKLAEHSPREAESLKMTRVIGLFLGLNKDEIRETDETFLDEQIIADLQGDELEQFFAQFATEKDGADVLDELLGATRQPAVDMRRIAIEIASKVVSAEGEVSDALVDQHFKKLHSKFRSKARQIREERINKEALSEPIEYLKDVTNRVQELADRIPILVKDSQFDSAKFGFHAKKTDRAISALQDALKRAFGE